MRALVRAQAVAEGASPAAALSPARLAASFRRTTKLLRCKGPPWRCSVRSSAEERLPALNATPPNTESGAQNKKCTMQLSMGRRAGLRPPCRPSLDALAKERVPASTWHLVTSLHRVSSSVTDQHPFLLRSRGKQPHVGCHAGDRSKSAGVARVDETRDRFVQSSEDGRASEGKGERES